MEASLRAPEGVELRLDHSALKVEHVGTVGTPAPPDGATFRMLFRKILTDCSASDLADPSGQRSDRLFDLSRLLFVSDAFFTAAAKATLPTEVVQRSTEVVGRQCLVETERTQFVRIIPLKIFAFAGFCGEKTVPDKPVQHPLPALQEPVAPTPSLPRGTAVRRLGGE
jgi:hypothetical protein